MRRTRAILIVGGSGFIGSRLALKLRETYKVYATYRQNPIQIPGVTMLPLSTENRNWVRRVLFITKPDVVVYLAGGYDVAWAEKNARLSERAHTSGAATVVNAASTQPKFIYVSSSYLFEGSRGNYHETDTILPANQIGKSHLGGENIVRGKSVNYIILRSSPVFGRSSGINLSFLDHLRMKLNAGQKVELPTHELHSWAPVEGLLDAITKLAESGVRNKIFHYGGLSKVNHYEFGRAFAQRFGYDPELVRARQIVKKNKFMMDEIFDYSLNSTQLSELLKIKPLLLEKSFDLIQ